MSTGTIILMILKRLYVEVQRPRSSHSHPAPLNTFPEKAGPFQGAGEAGEPLVAELAGGEADLLVADARKKSL